ncbi:MAG: peptidoglycan-associated lipoprotein Pal [Proteobacteria bacterium]|nr:peptidoglycan-associated lipoprotein Pal [Pseudomonadota bacterium]MBI3496510.1 peptidoglycan-associated lipoprotein Pal [Pseudomonadota bacterium]
MRMKLVSLIAASILLAACETAPSTTGAAGGAGAGSTSTATTTATPSGPTPGSQQDLVVNVGDRVFFDFNKSDLKPEARRTLERQAAWLKQYGNVRVAVEGHCDERGTREYNLALGERRANAAKDYLVSLGIPAARLSTISYGKERPAVLGSNEAAWSQNRRGVTVVQ